MTTHYCHGVTTPEGKRLVCSFYSRQVPWPRLKPYKCITGKVGSAVTPTGQSYRHRPHWYTSDPRGKTRWADRGHAWKLDPVVSTRDGPTSARQKRRARVGAVRAGSIIGLLWRPTSTVHHHTKGACSKRISYSALLPVIPPRWRTSRVHQRPIKPPVKASSCAAPPAEA